jgi:hypothetical protein
MPYIPKPVPGCTTTLYLNGITNQISHDGKNFLNLAGNLTKLYLDINLNDRMGFHLDSRIYWGLAGRRMSIERDAVLSVKDSSKRAHDYLDMDSEPVIKLNAAVWYTFLENGANKYVLPFRRVTLSLYAYDILGFYWRDNQFFARNTIRWMQMTFKEERDLFGVDLISIALRLQLDL